ncbi:hypothetical protein [Clostridium sp. Marseille-QA1073]
MEKLVLILVAFILFIGVLKVLGYYLLLKVSTPKQSQNNNKAIKPNKRKLTIQDDEIVASRNNVNNEYYILAKKLFKELLENKKINRQQIIHLKCILSDLVPRTEDNYKNDMHEIYSKLKSPFLTNEDYKRIVKYLNIIIDLNY